MNSKMLNLLMICRKAGKLVMGFDPSCEAAQKKTAKCILLACDVSKKTEKEVDFFCNKYNVRALKCRFSMEDVYSKLGRKSGILAIIDEGFANSFIKIAENE